MKLDILAFGAHPDDVELGAGGTLAKEANAGKKTGIIDLTLGELGTRGTPEIRLKEAKRAAEILGCTIRENLRLPDGFFRNERKEQQAVATVIRRFQPDVLLINAPSDRHPDHGRASQLVSDAAFLAGLRKWEIQDEGYSLAPWRPKAVYHYMQFRELPSHLIVDITGFEDIKMESVLAHKSQFYDPDSKEPETVISSKGFMDSVHYRSQNYGRMIGVAHAEAFIADRPIGSSLISHLI